MKHLYASVVMNKNDFISLTNEFYSYIKQKQDFRNWIVEPEKRFYTPCDIAQGYPFGKGETMGTLIKDLDQRRHDYTKNIMR